jgi:hypothetical protein
MRGTGEGQQFSKIEIVGKNNKTVFACPSHNVGVGRVGRAEVEPGKTFMAIAAKKLRPFQRHASVQQELHAAAGESGSSYSRVFHAA